MNRYRLSILFLLAIILFANQICAQTTPTYKISGNVIATATGKPFFYGMVLVNKKIYSCDSSGNFSIPDLPGGTYKLSFTAEYSTKDTLVTLTDKDVLYN